MSFWREILRDKSGKRAGPQFQIVLPAEINSSKSPLQADKHVQDVINPEGRRGRLLPWTVHHIPASCSNLPSHLLCSSESHPSGLAQRAFSSRGTQSVENNINTKLAQGSEGAQGSRQFPLGLDLSPVLFNTGSWHTWIFLNPLPAIGPRRMPIRLHKPANGKAPWDL